MTSHSSKISLSIGDNSFSAEGDTVWLSEQIKNFTNLLSMPQMTEGARKTTSKSLNGAPTTGNLATFLKAKDAGTSQNKKFLATAYWLQKNGASELSTKLITQALTDSKQTRLGNASECLNQNVRQGYCQKAGKGFYVTPEGVSELGEEE